AVYDAGNAYVITNDYLERKDEGKLLHWNGALKTNDAGASWHWVWKGGGGSGVYGVQDAQDASNLKDAWVDKAFGKELIQLMDAGVSPYDGNVTVLTDWYRTMKTTDGGKTWNEIYSIQNADSTYTTNGLNVTTCYDVHFDPFDSNHIAVSYTDIGFSHSFNRGKSWRRSVAGVPNEWKNTCYWVAFDPVIKNKVWSVWSDMHDIPRGKMTRNPQWKESDVAKGGVCVSVDGGETWQPVSEGIGMNSPATSIAIDTISPPGNRTLYVTVYNKGVFKSIDDGKTWKLKNNGIGENTCAFKITIAKNGNLFLTVSPTPKYPEGKKDASFYSGALYKSTDGAETWTKLNVVNGLLFPNGISIDPVDPDRVYLWCWANICFGYLVGLD
ncbi:MAG: WD40/YVTN/BNR-like repeat-containing protein, partial [Ginsengibacter sp.]